MNKISTAMIVWLCHAIIATSQNNASIQGIVIDTHSEAVLKSVSVKILNTSFFTETTLNGTFKLNNIPKGNYTLEFYLENYSIKKISVEIVENQKFKIHNSKAHL